MSERQYSQPVSRFTAGLCSGVTSAIALQPFDFLKTRVQQQSGSDLRFLLRDVIDGKHGLLTLWKGTIPSVLRTGFGSAIYFTSLDFIRGRQMYNPDSHGSTSWMSRKLSTSKSVDNLVAGSTARTFAGFVLMPLTVLKVRFESSIYNYNSILSATRMIYLHDGFSGFFAGFGATVLRDAPSAGLYVLFYELCRTHFSQLLRHDNPASLSTLSNNAVSVYASVNFMSGVAAGASCALVTNPFDIVKTRMQLRPDLYTSTISSLRSIIQVDGFKALFGGLALRMSRKAFSSALTWTIYEELTRNFSMRPPSINNSKAA